ncbi:DUF732 domain-containing protein [Corynebacterium cystitidis]|uniref:Uncharacterized protein n=1 Tax=Corynebacterium cystitidis DSM 20524 TaxID=1121357 RepID=A0A1H9TA23_9CORY|nr:DUF732 domain-containing protein [Corynebacterium cystitidis]WJY83520.1 hypothetical protein CCYS_13180 [Corynebacterium cystitidis DSM 20524]SER93976.1 hypothetical protein SAMN05661109_01377 [Corynebacterium cystitidis DSM 20524]SNV92332.1 putative secreted protein [Corynebacterium cystitidis]
MRRLTLIAMTLAAALSLAACGGATVESEDVTSSLSPAPATVTTSATETTTEDTTTTPVAPRPDQPEDIGAREIGEIPKQEPQYAPEEQGFLDEIAESNVNVADVEAQLIGTARTICRGDTITRDAVAGQLIEQGRTDLDHQEVSTLLDDAAHANLC